LLPTTQESTGQPTVRPSATPCNDAVSNNDGYYFRSIIFFTVTNPLVWNR